MTVWDMLDALMALPAFRAGFVVGVLLVSGWISWRAWCSAHTDDEPPASRDLFGGQW